MTEVEDVRQHPAGARVTADVCIIGSGPAGITVARELGGSGARVVVLESGGRAADASGDALNEIVDTGGNRVVEQRLLRARVFGGTSSIWSGRAATFDDVDFARRSWVPGSGWPLSRESLGQYWARSGEHLNLAVPDNNAPEFLRDSGLDEEWPESERLRTYGWTYSRRSSRPRTFLHVGEEAVRRPLSGVRVLLNATVTQIDVGGGGRLVDHVEVTAPDGLRRRVEARFVVLAAGGIENARILLSSNRRNPRGVGNDTDQVGRYLMDHPRGAIASFRPEDFPRAQAAFASHRQRHGGRTTVVTPGFALSRGVQEREHLLNAAAWVSGVPSSADPLIALKDLARLRAPRRSATAVVAGAPLVLGGVPRLLRGRSPSRVLSELTLQVIVEQTPDPSSRVTLADRRDAYGVPLSSIDWRVGELERRTVERFATVLAEEFPRLGIPVPLFDASIYAPGRPLRLPDVAHPTGTTRMSDDPATGVVDRDCLVHGTGNLYVAGSSVFPTSGHANPTQMIVALAVRLADHLRTRLQDGGGAVRTGEPEVAGPRR